MFVLQLFLLKRAYRKKKKQLDSFTFSSFLLYIEAQRTRFEESSVSGIKRLISNAVHSAQSLLTMHIIGWHRKNQSSLPY